jgi:hypothetical protein
MSDKSDTLSENLQNDFIRFNSVDGLELQGFFYLPIRKLLLFTCIAWRGTSMKNQAFSRCVNKNLGSATNLCTEATT